MYILILILILLNGDNLNYINTFAFVETQTYIILSCHQMLV